MGADDGYEVIDGILKGPARAWWERQDPEQRSAWQVLTASGAFAVLGVPIWGLLQHSAIPTSKNLVASAWLVAIALPVVGTFAAFVYMWKTPAKFVGPPALIAAVVVATAGVLGMEVVIQAAGGSLGDGFYCYNDGTVFEEACRTFRSQRLARTPPGNSGRNVNYLLNVFALTVEARGPVIAFAGIPAGLSLGYLIRTNSD